MSFPIVPPQLIVDATLLSTNVVETAPTAYSSGHTYALNDTASVATSGNGLDVYTSLLNANTGHAPTSSPTWWKKTGSTYGVFDIGQTYAADDIALDAVGHAIYQSVVGSNLGHDPTTDDGTHWVKVRPSNRWAAFDQSNSSQTTNPDVIDFTLQADGLVDRLGLTNVSAASVRVIQTDSVAGVVLDTTLDLLSTVGVDDEYAWCFLPPDRLRDVLVTLYPYADCTVRVIVTDTGDVPAIGSAILGAERDFADVQWGAQTGITDFSGVTQNAFGDRDIVVRGYQKNLNLVLNVPAGNVDALQNFFADYRSTPLLFQGSPDYGSTLVFGLASDFQINIPGPDMSTCSLTVKGLT